MVNVSESLRLKLAELALKSPQKEKHGAIITNGKKIICGAYNTPRAQYKNFIHRHKCNHNNHNSNIICFGHAEVNVINKFLSLYESKRKHCFLQVFQKKQKI